MEITLFPFSKGKMNDDALAKKINMLMRLCKIFLKQFDWPESKTTISLVLLLYTFKVYIYMYLRFCNLENNLNRFRSIARSTVHIAAS